MPDTANTIRAFYDAFKVRDGDTMAAQYAPDVTFEDPVFTLSGKDAGDMWRMLCERGSDLKVEYEVVDDSHAAWVATYTFEGHPVRNEIKAAFTFDDAGKIKTHRDTFDFPKWAGQALGFKGKLLGRTSFLHKAVRKTTASTLRGWQRGRDGNDAAPE